MVQDHSLARQATGADVSRTHKDKLFHLLFGTEERKGNALEVYNFLNGTDYGDASLLEFNTIDNVVYLGYKNDVSFIVGMEMALWEEQSTFCPNMPLRGLLYFAKLYEKYVEEKGLYLYGTRRLALPTPRYVVFYIGEEQRPESEVLRLSDSFATGSQNADLEVTATVLNINYDAGKAIIQECRSIHDYAFFVSCVRRKSKSMSLRQAVDAAVDECIDKGVLADFLPGHRAEVRDVLLTEWDAEKDRELMIRDATEHGIELGMAQGMAQGIEQGREQGIEQGIEQGREQGIEQGVEQIVTAARAAGVDEDTIARVLATHEELQSQAEPA